jgi:diguanylate cyclase (GGDEF)-like protein/PAS domain S-box-containing protein
MPRGSFPADNVCMSSSSRLPAELVQSRLPALRRFAQRHLPHGRTLPETEWQRRHRGILALLWVLAATLPLYGILQGHALGHDVASGLGLLAIAALASRRGADHAGSSAIASWGLCIGSAMAVHLANGAIEAHFMFFVMIIVISLYEDWRPFLIAFGFVVAHHGLAGVINHGSVYAHPGNPLVLALIHGAFVAAAGIASIVGWRLNESVREESRRASDRARESDARFRSAFEDGPLGMALVDMSSGIGTIRQVNRTLCRQFGHRESALQGSKVHALLDPAAAGLVQVQIRALLSGDVAVTHDELRLRHHEGHLFEGRISMSLVAGSDDRGPARHLIVQVEDVTERNRLKRELQDLADHDPLTGLVNRRRFSAELARRLDTGTPRCEGGAVILIDLDGFKEINDTLGHEAGDDLLIAVSAALRETCRADDTIARLGGDEFALLIANATASAARRVGKRIVVALRERAVIGHGATERRASASVGIVVYSRHTEMTGDQLLNDADLAMYEAKDDGGNRCVVYSADTCSADGADQAPSWPDRIRRALDEEHLTMYAQPIVDLVTGDITNFELLLRMIGPDGEIIPPGAFLPVAERRGMIRTIDRWVIGQAVKLLDDLGSEHDDDARAHGRIRLHVNLSGRSLSDGDFMHFIRALLDGAGVDPSQLVFEITETAAIANVDDACRFLTDLSELGCGIALDDFGAGFGSLHYLKNLPVDLLKIDGQFIKSLTTNPDDLVVVESLVRMAGGLRMRTAAEYVEDAATLQLIGDLGVDFGQGYQIGRPGPARQVIAAARSTGARDR